MTDTPAVPTDSTDRPARPNDAPYREITFSAVVLGVIQGAIMTASFVYIGLKLGFGLSGSTVAAILGFALLRGVGRGVLKIPGAGSIVENNINQTIASGINTASAGVTFTFPALYLLGLQDQIDFKLAILAAVARPSSAPSSTSRNGTLSAASTYFTGCLLPGTRFQTSTCHARQGRSVSGARMVSPSAVAVPISRTTSPSTASLIDTTEWRRISRRTLARSRVR